MAKPRVHEVAKELGLSSKEVLAHLEKIGEPATSHASTLEDDVADKVRSALGNGSQTKKKKTTAAKAAPKKAAPKKAEAAARRPPPRRRQPRRPRPKKAATAQKAPAAKKAAAPKAAAGSQGRCSQGRCSQGRAEEGCPRAEGRSTGSRSQSCPGSQARTQARARAGTRGAPAPEPEPTPSLKSNGPPPRRPTTRSSRSIVGSPSRTSPSAPRYRAKRS